MMEQMSVTLTFKNGNVRTFPDATQANLYGGIVILTKGDGSEVGRFDGEQVVTVNGQPLRPERPNRT